MRFNNHSALCVWSASDMSLKFVNVLANRSLIIKSWMKKTDYTKKKTTRKTKNKKNNSNFKIKSSQNKLKQHYLSPNYTLTDTTRSPSTLHRLQTVMLMMTNRACDDKSKISQFGMCWICTTMLTSNAFKFHISGRDNILLISIKRFKIK